MKEIIRFEHEDGIFYINLTKATLYQKGSEVEFQFKLSDEELEELGEEGGHEDAADLMFDNIHYNFAEHIASLPRQQQPHVHPDGEWLYWCSVDEDGEPSCYW